MNFRWLGLKKKTNIWLKTTDLCLNLNNWNDYEYTRIYKQSKSKKISQIERNHYENSNKLGFKPNPDPKPIFMDD